MDFVGSETKKVDRPTSEGVHAPRVHIITYGCQMNVFDSRRVLQILSATGFVATDDPNNADVILINTCSVRERPEKKVLATLSRLKPLKETRKGLVLGVCGCVAQQYGKTLLEKVPYLDLVFGPDRIADVAVLVEACRSGQRVSSTGRMKRSEYNFVSIDPSTEPGPTAFLTIMKGCDKVCTFCIVPFVRGREVSKPADKVLQEVHDLVANGVKEITLLGQNVNSYGKGTSGPDFVDLIKQVDAVPGLKRLRFVTSHPADADERMLSVFGSLGTVCEYLHLPVQAGSNAVLKRMRRGYSAAEYLRKIEFVRRCCPDIALSTDVIVGFPGETRADFEQTLALIRAAQFDSMFSFKYSPRPHTVASRMPDDVPEEEKAERLAELQELQDRISAERAMRYMGRIEEVLVEGRAARCQKGAQEWCGRTRTNVIVNFGVDSCEDITGRLISVRITEVLPHCLRGEVVAR